MLGFCVALADQLVGEFSSRKRKRSLQPGDDNTNHPMVKVVSAHPYKRCVMCRKAGVTRKTKIECGKCGKPLCAVPCFAEWHAPTA